MGLGGRTRSNFYSLQLSVIPVPGLSSSIHRHGSQIGTETTLIHIKNKVKCMLIERAGGHQTTCQQPLALERSPVWPWINPPVSTHIPQPIQHRCKLYTNLPKQTQDIPKPQGRHRRPLKSPCHSYRHSRVQSCKPGGQSSLLKKKKSRNALKRD